MPQVFPQSQVLDAGVTAAKQPAAPTADGVAQGLRADRYGAVAPWMVAPTRHMLAEEGSYLVATNPTPSTGMLNVAAQTAFSDTAPNFYIQNTDSLKSLYLDYLKLIATAVATSCTAINYLVKSQSVPRTFVTDNTLVIVPVNPNQAFGNISSPIIKAQNSATVSAMGASDASARIVARGNLGGLNVAGDEMLLTFGSTDAGAYPGTADVAGSPGRRGSSAPPIILGPGCAATIYFWLVGSAASIAPEFEMGMWFR